MVANSNDDNGKGVKDDDDYVDVEHLHTGQLALGGGEVERRPAIVVTEGHVQALQDKHAGHLEPSLGKSKHHKQVRG